MRKELINRQVVVNSTTTRFTYSTEFLTYACTAYHIIHRNKIDCAVYNTEDEARANIHITARRWGWDENECCVKACDSKEYITKHHRNKVKG